MLDIDELPDTKIPLQRSNKLFLFAISFITTGGSSAIGLFVLYSHFDRIKKGHFERIIANNFIQLHDIIIITVCLFAGGILVYYKKNLGWVFVFISCLCLSAWIITAIAIHGISGAEIAFLITTFCIATIVFLNTTTIKNYFNITASHVYASILFSAALYVDIVFILKHI